MNSQTEMAFQFAADLARQLITLSTGILALTITFTKGLCGRVPSDKLWTLKAAWLAYLLTIVFGIFSLMALTGTLAPTTSTSARNQVRGRALDQAQGPPEQGPPATEGPRIEMSCRIYAGLQVLCFLGATVFVMAYGITALNTAKRTSGFEDARNAKQ
ncbi:MAG TPA: hypothetical protein VMX13_16810 [Sedimentisphaerales bacterium]|nr:hypothetical protein [Sedimentisphaerales bacterium]